jgi:hypothetical protein
MEELRQTRPCCHCGRRIVAGHNFADYNLLRHEEACLGQQARERRRVARAASRAYRRGVAQSGGTMPGVGQLGFSGFRGIPEEVTG